MTRLFLVVAVFAAFGCAVPTATTAHTLSRARFDPARRLDVWGRSLEFFQERNFGVSMSDYAAGVLRSELRTAEAPCSGYSVGIDFTRRGRSDDMWCDATEAIQFTMSADGVALLRTNRIVRGRAPPGRDLVTDNDQASMKKRDDEALRAIVGEAAAAELPPAR
jgi:hypothetical protein